MNIIDGIGDVKGLIRDDIPKRSGGDRWPIGLDRENRLTPPTIATLRHARDLVARGSAKVARAAMGAVRVVRTAALYAHGTSALVLSLLAEGAADAQAIRCRGAPHHRYLDLYATPSTTTHTSPARQT